MKKIFYLLIYILILNSILKSHVLENTVERDSVILQKPGLTFLLGSQFNEGINTNTSLIIGAAFDLYNEEKISLPLDFMLHFMEAENHNESTFFPRIALNLKYNFIQIDLFNIFLQGGIGVSVLFPYLFDFSPIIGVSYKQIRLDIRNIFYFEIDGNQKFAVNRWPMAAVIFGLNF